jgi:DNA-binding CsgD family transcriptional regulator
MGEKTSFDQLTNTDLRRVITIYEQLHQAEPIESFVKHLHGVLDPALDNSHFSVELYQLDPFKILEQGSSTSGTSPRPLLRKKTLKHPYAKYMLTRTESTLAITHQDPPLREFLKSALDNDFYCKIRQQNHLWISLRNGNELIAFIYSREQPYTENELSIMQSVQSLLESTWHSWKSSRATAQELQLLKTSKAEAKEEDSATIRIRQRFKTLTARQYEVMEWVATGKDNQQIADVLKISVLTVKKHLQTIFQTLDIHHRTELVVKWHQSHSATE